MRSVLWFCASVWAASGPGVSQANELAAQVFSLAHAGVVQVEPLDPAGQALRLASGVVVEAPGSVVTTCHVLRGAASIRVRSAARTLAARLRWNDREHDLCQLDVPGLNIEPPPIRSARDLTPGSSVFALGAIEGGVGLKQGRALALRVTEEAAFVQTDVGLPPAWAGGGLFDEEGRLVGLLTYYLGRERLDFALPAEWLGEIADHAAGDFKTVLTEPSAAHRRWGQIATLYEREGDWPLLLKVGQRWSEEEPQDRYAWLAMATAQIRLRDYSAAAAAYLNALRIKPDDARIWNNLGTAYYEQGSYDRAVQCYLIAARNHPEAAIPWLNAGTAYQSNGDYANAVTAYGQALRLAPQSVAAWFNLATARSSLGQNEDAMRAYREVLRLNPEHADALYNLGRLYAMQRQREKLDEVVAVLRRVSPGQAQALMYQ